MLVDRLEYEVERLKVNYYSVILHMIGCVGGHD
jgi:hypothetical protein